MSQRRILRLLPGLALLVAQFSPETAATQDRPIVSVTLDRHGRLDPQRPAPVLRAPLDIRFEYLSTQVFDLSAIDAPKKENFANTGLQPDLAFMLYPEDNAIRFEKPLSAMNTVPPGKSTFYFMGRRSFRLRFTMVSEDELKKLLTVDSKEGNTAFLKQRLGQKIPEAKFVAAGNTRDARLVGSGALSALAKAGHDTSSQSRLGLMRVEVTVPAAGEKPIMLIEVGQEDLMGGLDIAYASLARVVVEANPVFLETRGVKRTRSQTSVADGIASATVADIGAGDLEAQLCAVPAQNSRLAALVGTGTEYCVPLSALKLRVAEQLPSRVRYQPGIIVADRGREPRLAAHMVFIRDVEGYFEKQGRRSWLAGVNPSAGIQVGGSESIVVLLLGLHARLVPEAGLQVGFRFGNENTNSGWWAAREAYFGISLDPSLFNKLRPAK